MQKKITLKLMVSILLMALLSIGLCGCGETSNDGASETKSDETTIGDLVMASEVNEDSYRVITQCDVFNANSPFIHVVGTLKGGKKDKTVVKASWHFTDGDVFIAEAETTAGYDEGPVWFHMSKPDNGWPVGDYLVKLYVDDEEVAVKSFSVE